MFTQLNIVGAGLPNNQNNFNFKENPDDLK